MTTNQFRLTVWKPLVLERRLARDGSKHEWPITPDDGLSVEAYRWQVSLDVWGSATRDDVASLRDALFTRFDPFKPSVDRGFDKLRDALEVFDRVLATNGTTWRECEQPIQAADGDDADELSIRANTIRSLRHHLSWIYRTFNMLPRASLTVR